MPDAGSCTCSPTVEREVRVASEKPLILTQRFSRSSRIAPRMSLRDDAARSLPAYVHNARADGVGHIRRPTSFKAERDFRSCRRH